MNLKQTRAEVRATVINLIDLGFTVSAVAHMVNKTPMAIYHHLNQAGRMKGRTVSRGFPHDVTRGAVFAIKKVFADPQWVVLPLMALAQQGASLSASPSAHIKPKAIKKPKGKKKGLRPRKED